VIEKDHFSVRAEAYDSTLYRLAYVEEMARSILEKAPLNSRATLVDFGAGTGLLTERIAPYVQRIITIDISPTKR